MIRQVFSFFCLLLTLGFSAKAVDTTAVTASVAVPSDTSRLRVSLVTCGVGDELYASFGHTAIRVIDSNRGMDYAFNYGTFSFDEDFYPKFIRGKLLYYVNTEGYNSFIGSYVYERRSVEEQLLLLSGSQKRKLYEFLQENALPENKYYKYDFLFDNCATRIRDVFPRSLGEGFKFAQVLQENTKLTFRNMIDRYLRNKHWERFGIDLALGSPIDKAMKNEDVMFLPDYLRDGLEGATLNGQKVSGPVVLLLDGSKQTEGTLNGPLVLTAVIALLTILGLTVPKLNKLGKVMSSILLFVTGLLGWFFLFMWLGTDHQSCQNNFNVLWALPTNLFLVFRKPKGAGKYAVIAMVLIGVSLLLHILKIQELPLLELGPLLLSLVFIYGTIYKRTKAVANNR